MFVNCSGATCWVLNSDRMQRIAGGSVADGGTSAATGRMAAIGGHGRNRNSNRDLRRHLQETMASSELEPYEVVLLRRSSSGELTEHSVPIILIHEVCWYLHQNNQMACLAPSCEALQEYWSNVSSTCWFQEHPHKQCAIDNPGLCWPLRLWGDDAAISKRKQLYCLTWSSAVCLKLASMISRFLFLAVPIHTYLSLDPLIDVLIWDVGLLAHGFMPDCRHDMQPFASKARLKRVGKTIMGGVKAILSEFTGDLKFLVETFAFEQFHGTQEACFHCFGTKFPGELGIYDFRCSSGWSLTKRLHSVYMARIGKNLRITHVPGWHLTLVFFDCMHSLHLGALPIVCGSSMYALLMLNWFEGPVGGSWKHRFSVQLRSAWLQFQAFNAEHRVRTSQGPFTTARLTLQNLSDPPILKGKAADNFIVLRFLFFVFLQVVRTHPTDENSLIASVIWGWLRIIDVCEAAPMFLNESQKNEIEIARSAALLSHQRLSNNAIANGSQLWRCIPKLHYLDHMLRGGCEHSVSSASPAPFRNPIHGWCFADEDFIGRVARIARRSSNMSNLVHRYLLRLHLMVERESISAPQL